LPTSIAAGRRSGPGIDRFHVAQGENVVMTLKTRIDLSTNIESANWTPMARRHRETVSGTKRVEAPKPADDELIFPTISSPPVWPRIFPSL